MNDLIYQIGEQLFLGFYPVEAQIFIAFQSMTMITMVMYGVIIHDVLKTGSTGAFTKFTAGALTFLTFMTVVVPLQYRAIAFDGCRSIPFDSLTVASGKSDVEIVMTQCMHLDGPHGKPTGWRFQSALLHQIGTPM